jgi:acyl-CoA thioesterase FadM
MTRVTTRFSYRVERPADGALLAVGATRHAAIDERGAPRRIPRALADALGARTDLSAGDEA